MPAKPRVKPGFRQQLETRERECFQFLNRLPMERDYVLIGGYAVSSFHFPRYSVDLDIAVDEEDTSFFRELAASLGFTPVPSKDEVEPMYRGRSEKFVKDIGVKVGIDLYINSVQSRDTGCAYSFQYLFANSEMREIRGRSLEARTSARVADKEMLIALKAQPMRPQDMGDIIALCYDRPNKSDVITHLRKCPGKKILDNLGKLQAYIDNPKPDSVRGAFSFGRREFEESVENCRSLMFSVYKNLSEPTRKK